MGSEALSRADATPEDKISKKARLGLASQAVKELRSRARVVRGGLSILWDWKIYAEFMSPVYQQHNLARLQHLDSLELDLRGKRVLEVGAGIGDHTLLYLHHGCDVLPTDARPSLVRFIRKRYGIRAEQLDVESEPDRLEQFGRFDILHCYGLLYHLSDPDGFLRYASRIADCLILETCVSPGSDFSLNPVTENATIPSQAFHGRGCRPTRRWIFETLNRYYEHVYTTKTQPHHQEFPVDWSTVSCEPATLSRAVFLASHQAVQNSKLTTTLPMKHRDW
jgi:SAM-dependent methyltransferase